MSNSITINFLLSPLGELINSSPFECGGGGGFNLMVSVLHKLEYKVETFKDKKVGGHAAEGQNQNLSKLPFGK